MRLSIQIKINEKELKKYTPNPIYEYSELIEVFREFGFVHRTPRDIGFVNADATKAYAEKAIKEAMERVDWLGIDGMVTECQIWELSEPTDLTHLIKGVGDKK